ncbi:MAG TPA: hypothetical protein VNM90_05630, partial [Haliangium sp.]|nr:hypothetical protein [Haliangium sp.]
VLVTGAGGPGGVAVIRSLLRRADVEVFAADMDRWASALYLVDAQHRRLVPAAKAPEFIEVVRQLCADDAIDVLFPTVDEELPLLAAVRDDLFGAVLASPPLDTLETCLDKLALARACARAVPVPRTELLGTVEATSGWDFPVIVKPRRGAGSRGVRVVAELRNFGAAPVEKHGIALRIEGRVVARGQVSLAPGERQSKQFLASLPTSSRFADVVVELDPDALSIDDRRHARTELREEVRALLVNGDPRTVRYEDELFYLDAALRPGDRADSGTALTTVTVDDLPDVRLADFDVVVLANVRALRRELVARLAAWIEAGGGLMLTVGENVDADAYAQTMAPLLPQMLRSPLDVSYGSQPQERALRALQLTKWQADHPIFTIFSGDAPGLREARFDEVYLLGPTTRVEERKVLARYTNGAVAMVEGRVGSGRVLLYTSTIDRDWNDLVIYPGFLPLMQQAMRYLARKQDTGARTGVVVGRSAVVPIQAGDTRLEIRGPEGARTVFERERLAERVAVRFNDADRPGFYRVWVTDQRGEPQRRPESEFAVNLDPRGSDLTPVPPERLPARDAGSVRAPVAHERRVELWHAIAAGLLLLLVVESLLVLR